MRTSTEAEAVCALLLHFKWSMLIMFLKLLVEEEKKRKSLGSVQAINPTNISLFL